MKISLVAGFGLTLALLVFAGADALSMLRDFQARHRSISASFISRHHALDRIRSAVYLSGAEERDYLLEPANSALIHRETLLRDKVEADRAITQYLTLGDPEDRGLVMRLNREIAEYWQTISPTLNWDAEQRRRHGYDFLRTEVFPRREVMMRIAGRIDQANEYVFHSGEKKTNDLFAGFRLRIYLLFGSILIVAVFVAALTARGILALESVARARFEETQRASEELQKLSQRLVEAQESERRSISRELHDEVGQSLSAVLLDIANLRAMSRNESAEYHALLDSTQRVAENCLNAVRNLSLLLRPSMLDDFGLLPALNWQAREVTRRSGMRVLVTAEEAAEELADEYRTCVYRVVQEALSNCCRHSAATSVKINVRKERSELLLDVEDDGTGFDAASMRGLGLIGMEERVKHLNGSFRIDSHNGSGTILRVRLPFLRQEGAIAQAS